MAKHRPASTILPLALALILFLALGFLASVGCEDSGTKSDSDRSGVKQVVVDEASLALMSPAGFRILLDTSADQMVENLGGDEAGLYAALLAVDRGYDVYQLLTGALSNQVDADGRILSPDGSVLPPARTTERIIHIPGGQAKGGPQGVAGGGDDARPNEEPVLLASTSGAVSLAYAGDVEDATATVAGISDLPIGDILDVIETNFEEGYAKTADPDSTNRDKYTVAILALASRGYNSQQIMEAAILRQIRISLVLADENTIGSLGRSRVCMCWYVEHTPGKVLKPVNPPLNIFDESCPAAGPKAAASTWPPDRVREALAELGLEEFAPSEPGPDTGADGEATADGQEPPSETGEDLDGIKDGIYRGEVYYTGQASELGGFFFEFPESVVEIVVTDEGVTATVEFVQRWSALANDTEATCIATVHLLFFGQGPVTDPLSLRLEPVVQEIVGLEGEDCGEYQQTLDEWAASNQTRILTGTFSDGRFEGDLGKPCGVWAETGD